MLSPESTLDADLIIELGVADACKRLHEIRPRRFIHLTTPDGTRAHWLDELRRVPFSPAQRVWQQQLIGDESRLDDYLSPSIRLGDTPIEEIYRIDVDDGSGDITTIGSSIEWPRRLSEQVEAFRPPYGLNFRFHAVVDLPPDQQQALDDFIIGHTQEQTLAQAADVEPYPAAWWPDWPSAQNLAFAGALMFLGCSALLAFTYHLIKGVACQP